MKLFTLKREQFIRRPIREVFSFFSKPENLAVITPKALGFSILTPSPISMGKGTLVDYTIALSGFRIRWTTLITRYEPPYSFVDVQLRGPYTYWHHTHSFKPAKDGTLMTDEVRYALPFGILGTMVHGLLVERKLRHIFDHRAEILEKLFITEPARVATVSRKRKV